MALNGDSGASFKETLAGALVYTGARGRRGRAGGTAVGRGEGEGKEGVRGGRGGEGGLGGRRRRKMRKRNTRGRVTRKPRRTGRGMWKGPTRGKSVTLKNAGDMTSDRRKCQYECRSREPGLRTTETSTSLPCSSPFPPPPPPPETPLPIPIPMPTPTPIPRNQFLARLEAGARETEAFHVRIPDRALPGSEPGALRALQR